MGTEESEFEDLSYNKVDEALKSVGVSIKDASGQFRDLDDVFLELSGKWNTLDRNSQRYIATIAAGSRQQSRFIAMMENYDRTVELVETAYDSAGKSSEQFAKYQDTVEYKVTQLKNTWEQMRIGFADSSFFKGAIDGLNGILETINDLSGGKILTLISSFLLLGKKVGSSLISGVQSMASAWVKVGNSIFSKISLGIKGKSIPINISDKKIQARINAIKDRIQEIEDKKIEIEIDGDTTKIKEDIKRIKNELQEGAEIKIDLNTNKAYIQNADGSTVVPDENEQTAYRYLFYDNKSTEFQEKAEQEQNLQKQKEAAEQRASMIGNIFATTLLTTITAITTEQDPGAAFVMIFGTGMSQVLPQLLTSWAENLLKTKAFAALAGTQSGEAFNAGFTAASGGTIWVVTAVVAAVAALTAGVMALNKRADDRRLENRLKAAKERADELEEKLSEVKKEFEEIDESLDDLKDINDEFDKLANKTVKTVEEQERYNELVEKIKEEYAGIVSFYDEENNKMVLNNSLLEQRLTLMEKQRETAAETLALTQNQSIMANTGVQGLVLTDEVANNLGLIGDDASNINYEDINAIINGNANVVTRRSEKGLTDVGKLFFTTAASFIKSKLNPFLKGTAFEFGEADIAFGRNIGDKTISTDSIAAMIGGDHLSAETAQKVYDAITNIDATKDDIEAAVEAVTEEWDEYADDSTSIEKAITEERDIIEEGRKKREESINQNKAQLAEMFTAQFKENEEITEIGAALGGQLVSTVAEAYTELGNQLQDIYTSEKFTSSIAEDAVNDLVDYSKSINVEILGSEEKALEDAIGDVQSGYNVRDNYNELKNETKAILEKVGIDSAKKYAEYTNEGALTDEEFAEKLLTDYAQTLNSELQQKMEEIVLKYQETVEKLAIADNMSITDWENQVERLKQQLSDQNLDDDQIQAFMDTIGETVVNEAKEALINADVKGINDLQVNTIKGLGEKFKELDEDIAKNVGVVINKFELSSDELAVLADMNWTGDISEMVNNAQLYIESLKDAGNDTTEATEKFRKIARDLAYAVGNIVTSSLQYEQMLADFMKNYGESGFGIDGFLDGKKQQIKDGTISATTYAENFDSLKDITEIVNKDGKIQIVFDEDDLSKIVVDAVSKGVQITQDQLDNTRRAYNEGFTQEVSDFINQTNYDEYMSKDDEGKKKMLEEGDFSIAEQTVIKDAFAKDITNVIDARKELFKALETGYKSVAQEWQFNQLALQEKINDSLEEEKKLQENLAEKERQKTDDLKAVTEARKALNEVTFGTQFWEAASDGLYNYEKKLDKLGDKIEDIQDKLKKSISYDDAQNKVSDLLNVIDEQSLTRAAQNSVINNYLQDNLKTLEQYRQQYGDFYSKNNDGTFNIDFGKLEDIKANDKIKESLEKLIIERNDYINKQDELNKQEQEQMQQFLDLQKEALDNYVSIQEDIASVLEKQAKEEVEQLKEKYDNMKAADDDYIDALSEAIAKQRELRDREKQYDDLAQQRKKLSLMQRDTSGANRKETLELQRSIEEQEENLLDSEIDNIIDNMKELQETQQEQRDALIENKEAIIENTNFLKEASLIQSTFSTQEDYSAWMLEHNPDVADWSPEKTEQMLKTWEEEYANMATYVALHNTSIDEIMTHTEAEILNKAQSISNGIETQSTDLMTKVKTEVDVAITNAAEKLLDANIKLAETESEITKINEKIASTQTNTAALQTAFEQYASLVKQKLKELEAQAALIPQVMLNPENKQIGDKNWAAAEVKARAKKLGIGQYASTTNNALTSETKGNVAAEVKARAKKLGVQYEYRTDPKLKNEPTWNDNTDIWYKISHKGYSKYTDNKDIAKNYFNKGTSVYRMTQIRGQENKDKWTSYPIHSLQAFAQGGLVNYTGPAWVDGTPNKPEAFLSAEDTARIGEAAKLLAQLPIFSSLSSEVPISSNVGDTSIEIHINVENLSSDYDVDQMIERVKKDIVDVSKPIGSSVILNK